MPSESSPLITAARAILGRLERLAGALPLRNPKLRKAVLLLASVVFLVGIWLSLRAQPDIVQRIQWNSLLLLLLVAIPATLAFNVLEFILSARLIGYRVGIGSAAETTIIGSVANMLPLPGGTMVRIAALKAQGASLAKGTSTTMFTALVWAGVTFAYAGLWLAILGQYLLGAGCAVAGLVTLAICFAATKRMLGDSRTTTAIVVAKIGLVIVDAFRMLVSLHALGLAANFGQASIFTISSLLGASFSIVPAGLGIREGASALLGPVVGISAAAAYLASSLSRIAGLAVSAPLALFFALRRR